MMIKRYKIAGIVIEITSIYEQVHCYCKDYLTDEPVDFMVTIKPEDITAEQEKTVSEYIYEGISVPKFSDALLEETAVYRKIAERMPTYDKVVFHGSCVAVDGQGYLFTAKSGTGKSTHTRLWREYLGDRAVMVNDDKPILQISDSSVTVYGTPYNGKYRLGTNISVPLKALCILERAEENHIERITKAQAYAMLLQQVYRPQDHLQMIKTLKLVDKMAERVELYRLCCNMDISAAEVAYNGMKG